MIRMFDARDLDQVMELWLNGNIEAHDFIPRNYWESNAPMVREQLLQAEIYVYETDGKILGFVGLQGDYLAGIFVDRHARSMGIGGQLIHYVQKIRRTLTLNVYRKNQRAMEFYLGEGFSVLSEDIDKATGETDIVLSWKFEERNRL
ncbi:MAG: N-acetyltransferase [Lacrimispora saccharolytica]